MPNPSELITRHLDVLLATEKTSSSTGRGRGKREVLYGITKLRELILEFAVRGLLVQQDPTDEPASELLRKVASQRAKLIKNAAIRADKALPEIGPDKYRAQLPSGWEWSRLGSFAQIVKGITFPVSEKSKIPETGRIGCLRTTNVQDRIEWQDLLYIRDEFVRRDDQIILRNDIVMSMANSRELVGKVAIVETTPSHKTTFGGFLGVIRPTILDPHFVMILLRSPRVKEAMIGSASQTTNIANVSLGKLKPLLLPIPPLAEQYRIVAKVEELMALCNQLEKQQEDGVRMHGTLVQTLLGALTSASERGQFAEAWKKVEDNFDTLFTTESSIDELKQTILQLAVMGKLVEQYPDEEPASELIKRIALEKQAGIEKTERRSHDKFPPITKEKMPFELPHNWTWARLDDLGITYIGLTYSPKEVAESRGIPVLRSSNVQDGSICLADLVRVDKDINPKLFVKKNDLLICARNGSKRLVGKCAVIDDVSEPMTFGAFMAIYRSSLNPYIKYFLESPIFRHKLEGVETTTINQLTQNNLRSTTIPLPPLAEQNRIVSKVNELMTLCDRLKVRFRTAQATQINLADSLVETAIH